MFLDQQWIIASPLNGSHSGHDSLVNLKSMQTLQENELAMESKHVQILCGSVLIEEKYLLVTQETK